MSVISVDFAKKRPSAEPYTRFVVARQEMLKALKLWLETAPDAASVLDEVQSTLGAVRGMTDLCGGPDA